MSNVAKLTIAELSQVDDCAINSKQAKTLLAKTPARFVKERVGRGGKKFSYVSGAYVTKLLNLMFGFDWDFEVVDYKFDMNIRQCIVQGKLTVRTNGKTITKTQFGSKDIAVVKSTGAPLSVGDDLKSATTDALKKCASLLGVAQDIYGKEDFKEIQVVDTPAEPTEPEHVHRFYRLIQNADNMDELQMLIDSYESAGNTLNAGQKLAVKHKIEEFNG